MRTSGLGCLAVRAILVLLCFPSCTFGQGPISGRWITHTDSQHYSVESPPGWTVSPDRQKGWVRLVGSQGETVVIWPVFIPGTMDVRVAPLIHARLAAASPYYAQWETPQAVAPNVVRARASSGDSSATSVFTWVSSPKGIAGLFFVVAARPSDYRQKQNDFARILQSFRLMGAATATARGAPATIQYVQFSDQKEAAFTVEVPAGWKTEGGMFRANSLDYRPAVQTVSPDGQTLVFVGDAAIPQFVDPTGDPYLSRWPEGMVYAPYGFASTTKRFTSGAMFCRDWAFTKFSQICPNLQVSELKDRSDLIPTHTANNPEFARYAQLGRLTVGEATFRCGEPAQPKIGLCGALTAGTKFWKVREITGYLAPSDKASTADAIRAHMLGSRRFNVEWATMQLRNEGATSQMISATATQIAESAARSQRARDAVDDEIARRRSNATLGVVDMADPETGRRVTVESGFNYYWVDPRGVIVGTNTETRPKVDFRALVQLP